MTMVLVIKWKAQSLTMILKTMVGDCGFNLKVKTIVGNYGFKMKKNNNKVDNDMLGKDIRWSNIGT